MLRGRDRTYTLPVDYLGPAVTILGVVVIGWLALDGRDIGQSVASIAQLLIAAVVFGLAVYYLLGLIILEGFDYHGRGARLASEVMLVVIPASVAASVVLTAIRT
jgi:hypothetical protein